MQTHKLMLAIHLGLTAILNVSTVQYGLNRNANFETCTYYSLVIAVIGIVNCYGHKAQSVRH